jgi:butyrate kinase
MNKRMGRKLILAINPGSTSTKISIFDGNECVFEETIRHYLDDLIHYPSIISQFDFRRNLIMDILEMSGLNLNEIAVIMGRGGLTYPLKSGVYEIDDRMLVHVRRGILGQHASNLGPLLAYSIAKDIPGAKAYIADPVVTDELEPIARISGHPRFERLSIYHALNQKAVSRLYAIKVGRSYGELNLIVAHMGGGVSIGAHCCGKVIDVNNALDGEGPFSPERSGTLPSGQLISACFSQNFSEDEIREMINGEGGLVAYLKTNSMIDVEAMAENGNDNAKILIEAFAYQVSKSIGEMATVFKGKSRCHNTYWGHCI